MEAIFHEQQDGSLCAQHCLNSLLQGQYYTAVDLADIARQLDDEERRHRCKSLTSDFLALFLFLTILFLISTYQLTVTPVTVQ